MNKDNTALVICGPYNDLIIKLISYYKEIFVEIVVSTYENDNKLLKEINNVTNVKVIENKMPELKGAHNSQNIFYQSFSSFHGMEQVESQFAIKLRSDEFYSNLDKLILTIPDKKQQHLIYS